MISLSSHVFVSTLSRPERGVMRMMKLLTRLQMSIVDRVMNVMIQSLLDHVQGVGQHEY